MLKQLQIIFSFKKIALKYLEKENSKNNKKKQQEKKLEKQKYREKRLIIQINKKMTENFNNY